MVHEWNIQRVWHLSCGIYCRSLLLSTLDLSTKLMTRADSAAGVVCTTKSTRCNLNGSIKIRAIYSIVVVWTFKFWFGEYSTKKQQDWQTPLHEDVCRALCQCHWRLFPWRIRRHGLNYTVPHLGADANLSLPLPAKHRRDVGQAAGFHIYSISLTNDITRNIFFFLK